MTDKYSYRSILKPGEGIYTEKGSKFMGYIYPISSENEFKTFIKQLKADHPQARHFCYGYRIGKTKTGITERSNDDSEPSGTAGKPILNQILSNELTEVCIVVVRYFGGTLLGTTGLIQAYKGAAKAAIENSVIVEKPVTTFHEIKIPYSVYNEFMNLMKKNDIHVENLLSNEIETIFKIETPWRIEEQLLKEITNIIS